jgi:hypothetical protein
MTKVSYDSFAAVNNANPCRVEAELWLGFDAGAFQYDRTHYLMSFNITHENGTEGLTSTISYATVVVSNLTGHFTPDGSVDWWDVAIKIKFARNGVFEDEFVGYIKEHQLSDDGTQCTFTCWDRTMLLQKSEITTIGNLPNGTDGNPLCTNHVLKVLWDSAKANTWFPAACQLKFINSAGVETAGSETVNATKVYAYFFDKSNTWDEMKELTEADGGRLWWTKDGLTLYYIYGDTVTAEPGVGYEPIALDDWTSLSDLSRFSIIKKNDIINSVKVTGETLGVYDEVNDRFKNTKWKKPIAEQYEKVFTMTNYFPIKAGATEEMQCPLTYVSSGIQNVLTGQDLIAWSTPTYTDEGDLGFSMSANINVISQVNRPKRVTLTITNTHPTDTAYVYYLSISALAFEYLIVVSDEARDPASIAIYGEKGLTMSNKYIRTEDQIKSLSQNILNYRKDNRVSVPIEIQPMLGIDLWDTVIATCDYLPNRNLDGTMRSLITKMVGRISRISLDWSSNSKPRMNVELVRIKEWIVI